jgi:hypothetical protein
MSERLGNYLVDLSSSPELLARFHSDPEAELARAGLTPDEQAAMRARDSRRLGSALGISLAKSGQGVTIKKKPAKPKKGPRKSRGPKKIKR